MGLPSPFAPPVESDRQTCLRCRRDAAWDASRSDRSAGAGGNVVASLRSGPLCGAWVSSTWLLQARAGVERSTSSSCAQSRASSKPTRSEPLSRPLTSARYHAGDARCVRRGRSAQATRTRRPVPARSPSGLGAARRIRRRRGADHGVAIGAAPTTRHRQWRSHGGWRRAQICSEVAGRPPAPSEGEQAVLRATVFRKPRPDEGGGEWTLPRLCAWIEGRFGKRLHPASLSRIVRGRDLSRQKTRPVHPRADPRAQAAFAKGGCAAL